MKRIVICCDGTWNRLDAACPTNVVKLAEAVAPGSDEGIKQIVWYDEGVGSGNTTVARRLDRWLGGAFGSGLMTKVEHAYRFLVFNYDPGDEIYIFGFSRGAYTARSLAGLIRNCAIIERSQARRIREAIELYRDRDLEGHPDSFRSCEFRFERCPSLYLGDEDIRWRQGKHPDYDPETGTLLKIRYLGVWDTVGALGLPNYLWIARLFNRKYEFHDAVLSRSVMAARHAVALDEYRRAFEPSLWTNLDALNEAAAAQAGTAPYEQMWFPGDHSSVGGGGDIEKLSSLALLWLVDGAAEAGLAFRSEALEEARSKADHRGPLKSSSNQGFSVMRLLSREPRRGPRIASELSEAAYRRWREPADALPEQQPYRPPSLDRVAQSLK